MSITKLFPIALIILDVCAALVYLWYKDYRHFIYWIAAAVLTSSITF